MESSFLISTAISRLQGFTNDLKRVKPSYVPYVTGYERALTDLVTMLSVFAPLFGAQLRQALGKPPVAMVWLVEMFRFSIRLALRSTRKFSRTRSKITMVSFSE